MRRMAVQRLSRGLRVTQLAAGLGMLGMFLNTAFGGEEWHGAMVFVFGAVFGLASLMRWLVRPSARGVIFRNFHNHETEQLLMNVLTPALTEGRWWLTLADRNVTYRVTGVDAALGALTGGILLNLGPIIRPSLGIRLTSEKYLAVVSVIALLVAILVSLGLRRARRIRVRSREELLAVSERLRTKARPGPRMVLLPRLVVPQISDTVWTEAVMAFLKDADCAVVLMDRGLEMSPHIQWEIEQIRARGIPGMVITVGPDALVSIARIDAPPLQELHITEMAAIRKAVLHLLPA